MKHNKTSKIVAAAAASMLVFAGSSCEKNAAEKVNESSSSLEFECISAQATFVLKGSADSLVEMGLESDALYSDSVSLIMPKSLRGCDVTELRDSIVSIALQIKGVPVEKAVCQWIDTMGMRQDFSPEKISDTWNDQKDAVDIASAFVVNLTPRVLVYCITNDGYFRGAAHGSSNRRYINFDMAGKGSIITLERLFTAEGLKKLPALIAARAESMSDNIGATTITELPENGNFFLSSEDEIVFSYQPYEVASYAQGFIEIPFYAYELFDEMTPYAIDYFGLQNFVTE